MLIHPRGVSELNQAIMSHYYLFFSRVNIMTRLSVTRRRVSRATRALPACLGSSSVTATRTVWMAATRRCATIGGRTSPWPPCRRPWTSSATTPSVSGGFWPFSYLLTSITVRVAEPKLLAGAGAGAGAGILKFQLRLPAPAPAPGQTKVVYLIIIHIE